MRSVPVNTLFRLSFRRTRLILFQPFSAKKWLKLVLIAYFAGALTFGGRGSGLFSKIYRERESSGVFSVESTAYAQPRGDEAVSVRQPESGVRQFKDEHILRNIRDMFVKHWRVWVALGVLIVILSIIRMWLGGRFRFIWYNALVNNTDHIGGSFREYRAEGNSYFKFLLALTALGLVQLGLVVWMLGRTMDWSAAIAQPDVFPWLVLLKMYWPLLAGMIVFGIVAMILEALADHFLVSVMAFDRCSFVEAWRRFAGVYAGNRGDVWLYILITVGMYMAVGVAYMIFVFVLILPMLLFGGLCLLLVYFFLSVLFKLKTFFWVVATVLGFVFAIVVMVMSASIQLPVAVFFRCFSLYYLSSLPGPYNILPLGEEAPLSEPSSPPSPPGAS